MCHLVLPIITNFSSLYQQKFTHNLYCEMILTYNALVGQAVAMSVLTTLHRPLLSWGKDPIGYIGRDIE